MLEEQDKQNIIAQYMEKDAEILKENGVAPHEPQQGAFQNGYWKFVGAFLAIVVIGVVAIPFIGNYITKQQEQAKEEQFAAGQQYIKSVEEQLKNDTDGGKTPEETLGMFIAALKANDIEKAKLYYSPYPENRSAMFKARLDQLNREGKIAELVEVLGKVTPEKEGGEEGYASYSYVDNGKISVSVDFTKAIQFSDIWKIENLGY